MIRAALRVALLGAVMALLAAAPASAQEGALKLRLTYGFPDIDTDIRLDPTPFLRGSSFTAEDTLQADLDFLLPGFELDFDSGGYGRFLLEYQQLNLRGADFLREDVFFDGIVFPRGAPTRARYEFKTLNFTAIFGIPLEDWIDLNLRFSARYVEFYTSITAPTALAAADDKNQTIVPTIGLGADLFVFDQVYLFGSYEALGYSIDGGRPSKLLFLDDDSNVFTRDWRLGARYEIVSWASIALEYRSLTLRVKKGKARNRQDLDGLVLSVTIAIF